MPDLRQSLSMHEPYVLSAIANVLGYKDFQDDLIPAADLIAEKMLDDQRLNALYQHIPAFVRPAIAILLKGEGKVPVSKFYRSFGELESIGESRFQREQPWLELSTPAAWLWYHGFIQKSFFDGISGLQEYVYLPDEIYDRLSADQQLPLEISVESEYLLIRPAAPREVAQIEAGNDSILDLSCLLLAAVRTGNEIDSLYPVFGESKTRFANDLLRNAGILDQENVPVLKATENFLKTERFLAHIGMIKTWKESENIDELRLIPELNVDRLFVHNPSVLRSKVFQFLRRIQGNGWWSFSGFVSAIKQDSPDFLREQGDSATWLIRNLEKSQFRDWENIEGEYLRFLLGGPFHWLGIVDIAFPANPKNLSEETGTGLPVSAFRISRMGEQCLDASLSDIPENRHVRSENSEKTPPKVTIDGQITVSAGTSRSLRYHIARYCEWEKILPNRWIFRITPRSLKRAAEMDLPPDKFVGMLRRAGDKSLPEPLMTAIERWIRTDTQATMFQATVLTVTNPEWIVYLVNSKDTSKWIQQRLNPNTVLIRPKGEAAIRRALIDLGALTDMQN